MTESFLGAAAGGALGTLFVRLTANGGELMEGMKEASEAVHSHSATMLKRVEMLAAGITGTLAVIGTEAVHEFAKFQKAMIEATSVMEGLTDRMQKRMSDAAREIAKESTQSAESLAKSYRDLAQAGLGVEQSMKALPIVAELAEAGQMDAKRAADLLVDALGALGQRSKDAGENVERMAHLSDLMSKASMVAHTTIEQFGQALIEVGPMLRATNKGVEEAAAVLGVLAEQGIRGAAAAGDFNMTLRQLQRAAVDNKESFKLMGVEVFDQSGKMKNMADILASLEKALEGASTAERKAALQMLGFQDRTVNSMLALIGMSTRVREMQTAMDDAGEATKKMADADLKALHSQLEIAEHKFHDLMLEIGERLAPAAMELIKRLQGILEAMERVEKETGALSAILGTIGDVIRYLAFGVALVWTALRSLSSVIGVLVTRDLEQLRIGVSSIIKLFGAWWDVTKGVIQGLLSLGKAASGAADVFEALVKQDFAAAANAWVNMQKGQMSAIFDIGKAIKTGVQDSLRIVQDADKAATKAHEQYAEDSKEAVKDIAKQWYELLEIAVKIFPELDPGLQAMKHRVEESTHATKELAHGMKEVGEEAKKAAETSRAAFAGMILQGRELVKILRPGGDSGVFTREDQARLRAVKSEDIMGGITTGRGGNVDSSEAMRMLKDAGFTGARGPSDFGDPLTGQTNALAREKTENELRIKVLEEFGKKEMEFHQKRLEELGTLSDEELKQHKELQKLKEDEVKKYNDRLHQLHLQEAKLVTQAGQQMFDALAQAAEGFAGKQSAVYKAMFTASKAFAIAESLIKIQQGIANALSLPWPANLVAAASVVAAAANIVTTIQSVQLEFSGGQRAAGGPVSAGESYLVGERGPEVFTPSSSGAIIPNHKLGGPTRIVINNYTDARPEVTEREENGERIIDVVVRRVKADISSEVRDGRGEVSRSMEQSWGLRRGH